MIDNFSTIITNAREKGKLIFKKSGIKSISKNNLQFPFTDVYYLDLSENKFSSIPDVITEFICLEVLLCSHNMIRCLPSNINNISYLETLDLSCNHLTSLHPSICKLQCLKILMISSNRLVSLPTNIGRLGSLEELDSSCNSLTCLPEELASLNRLRYLNLRHNKLIDIPANLHKLELEVLDLSENQLISIPNEYHRIDTLQTLNLTGNPLNSPPANVYNKGLQHILKYLQSEFKRQSARNLTNFSAQNSLDYGTANGCYKSESLEINGVDSTTVTSNNSQHSEFDFEHNDLIRVPDYSQPYLSSNFSELTPDDRHSYHQTIRASVSTLPSPKSNADSPINSENKSNSTLSTVEEIVKPSPSDGHFKKNRNVSLTTGRISSPAINRMSRYVSKAPLVDLTQIRRNSVPSNERVAQSTNVSNQEVELSSQCIVEVDNSNNESRKSSSHSIYNQSNNNNSNRFLKNVPNSPVRVFRPRIVESDADRKSSIKSNTVNNSLSPRPLVTTPVNSNVEIQEKISKFHKIIEAQLHVHISSKKLSEELSNGIYLCHLANILVPHSIPTVHTPSPGQQELAKQKSKRNLDNFLEACRRNGVPERSLFHARDVLNRDSNGLLQMAETVDALLSSLRTKRARPSMSHTSSTLSDHVDWHGILSNPQSLSYRSGIQSHSTRSSLQGYKTVGRPSKTTHRIVTSIKMPVDDIVQYSSEV